MLWMKTSGDTIVVYFAPADDAVDYGMANLNLVRGASIALLELRRVRQDLCAATFYNSVDAGGRSIPVWVANSLFIGNALRLVRDLRDAFQRDAEIDATSRRDMISKMDGHDEESESGNTKLDNVVFDVVRKVSQLKGSEQRNVDGFSDPLVTIHVRSNVYVAELIVDANVTECVAWLMQKSSRQRTNAVLFRQRRWGVSEGKRTQQAEQRGVRHFFGRQKTRGFRRNGGAMRAAVEKM